MTPQEKMPIGAHGPKIESLEPKWPPSSMRSIKARSEPATTTNATRRSRKLTRPSVSATHSRGQLTGLRGDRRTKEGQLLGGIHVFATIRTTTRTSAGLRSGVVGKAMVRVQAIITALPS